MANHAPSFFDAVLRWCSQGAVADAREKERRKRRGGSLLLAGLCVPPKALAPLLPIYLQGVLQVRAAGL